MLIDMSKKSIGRTSLSAPALSALAQLGADLALARARRSLSLRGTRLHTVGEVLESLTYSPIY